LWEKRKTCNDVRSAEKKSCWKKSSEKITKNSTWGVFLSLRFFVCSKSQKGEWVALFRLCFGPKWVVDLFSVSFFFFLWVIILFLEIPRYQFFFSLFFPPLSRNCQGISRGWVFCMFYVWPVLLRLYRCVWQLQTKWDFSVFVSWSLKLFLCWFSDLISDNFLCDHLAKNPWLRGCEEPFPFSS
jgi:hypothetical protein